VKKLSACMAAVLGMVILATASLSGQNGSGHLTVYGDLVYFLGPGKPLNCTMSNRYKRGDPVGFRATAINPATGTRDKATQLVVHLTYGGKTIDIPMRDRQTVKEPEREFWVAKWIVPEDAPLGIVRYTLTARDPHGRAGEFKPFEVQASQITIVE
jgi:hypothetical protein